jgi:hypothetical protein
MNVAAGISAYDVADRLPPLARERMDAIRQKAIDAGAVMRVQSQEVAELNAGRRDLEARRKQLTGTRIDPGFGLDEGSSQVLEVDREIDRSRRRSVARKHSKTSGARPGNLPWL